MVTAAGRHCEAGDIPAGEVVLPGDERPGDLLAVPAADACHLSLAPVTPSSADPWSSSP
jgi:diaminopimelate decarboxylase